MIIQSEKLIQNPFLSVVIITYNQEKYIQQCVESILNQVTEYAFEIIIGEDCGTDSTRDICIEYQKKFPEKIKLLVQESNKGLIKNYHDVLSLCRGKYIAQCAGDDYWIDNKKLQKQVNFLEINTDYVLSHTNGYRLYKSRIESWGDFNAEGDVKEIFKYGCLIRACTVVITSRNLEKYFELIKNCESKIQEDWALFAIYSTLGKFHYLEDFTAIYRFNSNSVTNRKNLKNYYLFAFDVIKTKRFLRDYVFKGELNEEYSEDKLEKDENYLRLRQAFDYMDFKTAKELAKFPNKKNKAEKLSFYTHNVFLFYFGVLLKRIKEYIYNIRNFNI